MKLPQVLHSVTVFMVFILASLANAQTLPHPAASQVEVQNVKFNTVRSPNNTTETWWEAEVDVAVKPSPDSDSGRFVNRVAVTLSIGIEVKGGEKSHDFFRATAEAITIEQGKATFRFYLPPEVVRRDTIRGDAKYYLIEVTAGGVEQTPSIKNVSASTLSKPELLQSFRTQIASNAGGNDGILIPQYLSPFAFDSSKRSPSFVRREQK